MELLRIEVRTQPSQAAPEVLVAAHLVERAPLIPRGEVVGVAQAHRRLRVKARLRESRAVLSIAGDLANPIVGQSEDAPQHVMGIATAAGAQVVQLPPRAAGTPRGAAPDEQNVGVGSGRPVGAGAEQVDTTSRHDTGPIVEV